MKISNRFKSFLYVYALFFVLCFSVITMAKYTGMINKSSNVSVAKWNVTVSGKDTETLPTIVIGDSSTYQEYNLNVTSKSDVALNYSLLISNAPDDLIVEIDNNIEHPIGNRIVVNNLGYFDANDSDFNHTHKLKFIVPINSDTIIGRELNIDVTFTQVNM